MRQTLAAFAAVLFAGSCASTLAPAALSAVEKAPPALSSLAAWTNSALQPIGQPKAVGRVAVGIVSASGRGLLLVGLDPTTGRKLWQQPITPSLVTPGVRVSFQTLGE